VVPHVLFALSRRLDPAMTSTLGRFRLPAHCAPHLYLIAGASLGSLLFLRHVSSSLRADKFKTLLSPGETVLPRLSDEEVKKLPYPPDALPGARDVDSPYGSVRVYEWGPENGSKILLIHGISTPSIALTDLAHKLVGKGCRVMLFGKCRPFSYLLGCHDESKIYEVLQVQCVISSSTH
jgi:hypothetical protein